MPKFKAAAAAVACCVLLSAGAAEARWWACAAGDDGQGGRALAACASGNTEGNATDAAGKSCTGGSDKNICPKVSASRDGPVLVWAAACVFQQDNQQMLEMRSGTAVRDADVPEGTLPEDYIKPQFDAEGAPAGSCKLAYQWVDGAGMGVESWPE